MEELDSKKGSSLKLPQMSERQAILYFGKGGNNPLNSNNAEIANQVVEYHKYWLHKKKMNENAHPKEVLEERKRLYQLSLKEYIPIKKNIYIDRKKKSNYDYEDGLQCSCKPNYFTSAEIEEILRTQYKDRTEDELFGCREKCMNRAIYLECDENCPCGESCRNRAFQRQEYADVYPIKTENRGWGLCAGSDIKKDTFIMQYIGEIYSLDSEYGKKKMKEYKDKECTYLMDLPNNNKHEVIDPTKKGNMARFINHSCDPNCETRKWHVKSELCIGIFAKRDIKENEELTFNYDFDLSKTRYQRCLCGAKNCRGYLGISTEDNKKISNRGLTCGICKENCRHSDSIIDCKTCGKFFHKKCAKKKGEFSEDELEYKCAHCLKKSLSINYSKSIDGIKEKIKLDEDPIYDEMLKVGDEDLQKIRKNLSDLNNIGAQMFWDFQSENAILGTNDKIDLRISGTTKQIEGVKEAIKLLQLKKEGTNDYIIKLQIPKIFIRKIIGHQYRNLENFKTKYGVQILYDNTLITDDIFPIQENTTIEIKGKESNAKAVSLHIKQFLYNLKVISIYLLEEDYFILRQKICNIKNNVHPADLRLRKLDSKNEREIKHPFYYISNNMKDIVIIGLATEIEKARIIIKNFLLRQNNIAFNYSLNILFPIYFKSKLQDFLFENKEEIDKNKIKLDPTDPEYLRRHISLNIRGHWPAITQTKTKLWKYLKNYAINTIPRKHDINEFEQYAYNQEHKLISKSIRTYIVEQSPQIKNWDYISEDVEYLQQKYFDQKLMGQTSPDKKKEGSNVIENFIYTIDKETRINYLVNMRPGAYKKVFKMTQNDLFEDIIGVLEETYNSYQSSQIENNKDMKSEDYYGYSDRDKIYKNDDGFAEPQKINSALFHQNDKYHFNTKNSSSDFNMSNYDSNKKKYIDNPNNSYNNQLNNNYSNNKKPYIDSQKSNLSTNNHSYNPSSQYKGNTNYKNNNNSSGNIPKINSFLSPLDRNSQNGNEFSSKYDGYGYFQRKENNDNSSNSSYLYRKTNRPDSRSPSERRKPGANNNMNNNNYYDKEAKGYPGKYKNYFRNYDKEYKDYDSYDKNKRKNSPYRDYYYNDSDKYNHDNDYSRYSDKDHEREKERDLRRDNDREDHDRDNRDRGRDMNSWYRSGNNDIINKNKYDDEQRMEYRDNTDGHNGSHNSYIKDSYNYRNNYKDSFRNYPQGNRDNNYSGNRNIPGNDIKNNDNKYSSSKFYYDDGYNRKRFFNDNNYMDKRKSEYKGNSSNYISGNKYSDRQERSRSRSRSWVRNHNRYRRDMIKRDHSHSKSFHKFNDNYE